MIKQQLLFPKIISTISYSQEEIIEDALQLHSLNKVVDCDPTYSTGNFYGPRIEKPMYRFDIEPQVPGVVKADARHLPLPDGSILTMVVDPPFIIRSGDDIEESKIAGRFSCFQNFGELEDLYKGILKEAYRVLADKGIVIFKCQDSTAGSSKGQYWTHVYLMQWAEEYGFYAKDLFILLAKARMIDSRMKVQRHGRKFHSYFWVFKK